MTDETQELAGDEEGLFSLEEAVKFLNTSKSTFYRLLNQQDIKGVKVGKQWRFRKPDLVAYMERGPVAASVDATVRLDLDNELGFFHDAIEREGKILDPLSEGDLPRIAELAGRIVRYGCLRGASDIHLEPAADALRLRFRIDGVLHDVRHMPPSLHESLIGRFKEICDMNLIEKRLLQDGRFLTTIEGNDYDVRSSLVPSLFGESLVMRILDRSHTLVGLDRLEMAPDDLAALRAALHRGAGLVLATGPTGSGKTTLMYSCLAEINAEDKKLLTIEDPVEYQMPDVTQIQVNLRIGLTFAAGLRSAGRQDPDAILCGEIRDKETVDIAMRLALTGHLVLSALHAENAVSAVGRLVGIGIEPFTVASALKCIMALRLARRLCPHCKKQSELTGDLTIKVRKLADEGGYLLPRSPVFYEPAGCEKCYNSGYRGRIGLYEVLACTPALITQLAAAESDQEATRIAVTAGMKTLLADGLRKAIAGDTSLEEVLRATGTWL